MLNIVVFSDLDGTLLSFKDYSWKDAEEAIEFCKKKKIPIVLVSSKTRAEIEVIREEMDLDTPFVSENGGAIFIEAEEGIDPPKGAILDGRYFKLELGTPYSKLVKTLRKIRDKLGWNIKGFSDMTVEEISYLTGLDLSSSYLASLREYDEPFLILDKIEDLSPLLKEAEKEGLRVFKGGRFYHIQGRNDKGKAVEILRNWYKKSKGSIISIALGDSPNDFPMLEKVDYPIIIPSDKNYSISMPNLKVSKYEGPKGWKEEVLDLIKRLCRREI